MFGYLLGRIVISAVLLPHYFKGELFTAYELMQRRFGTRLKSLSAAIFLGGRAMAEGVRLWALAIFGLFATLSFAGALAEDEQTRQRSLCALRQDGSACLRPPAQSLPLVQPAGHLTPDRMVDNVTLYWLTGTGASAARWYWEFGRFLAAAAAAGQAPPAVAVPVGFTTFPGEIWAAPRSWVETVYPDLAYFNEVDRGGHFAAWEEPQLFSEEVRAAFRAVR